MTKKKAKAADPGKMISIAEAAAALGVSERRVRVLCNEGRIEGAQSISGVWVLPSPPKVKPADRQRPGKIKLAE